MMFGSVTEQFFYPQGALVQRLLPGQCVFV